MDIPHKSWRGFTDDSVLDWLQEPSYPSIRYYTLRHLLRTPADDATKLGTASTSSPPSS